MIINAIKSVIPISIKERFINNIVKENKHIVVLYYMFVKEYNKNTYIFLNPANFLNKKYFYEELIRIKFNKKLLICNTIEDIKSKMKVIK